MPSAAQPEDAMEVVTSEQVWKETDNDELVFDHIRVIDRYMLINAAKLDLEEMPDTFLQEQIPAGWTRAPDPLPANSYYIKQPKLLEYGETSNCCTVLLRRHPHHPNIARYYGCAVEKNDGRFGGICLQRYSKTLKKRVEQRHANAKDEREPVSLAETEKKRRRLVQGIRDGAAHLQLLVLVHNNLNPSSVVVEEDDDATIIIDFGSCWRQGEPMGMKGPTPGWGTDTEYANRESDVRNLDQIERYLIG